MPHSIYRQVVQATTDSARRVLFDRHTWEDLGAGVPGATDLDGAPASGETAPGWQRCAVLPDPSPGMGWPYRGLIRQVALRSPAEGEQELELRCDFRLGGGPLGAVAHQLGARSRLDAANVTLLDELARRIRDAEWAHKATVQTLLNHKGNDVETASPGTTVARISEILRAKRIGAVLIVGNDKNLLGLVSERDVVCALDREGADVLATAVERIMSTDLVVCAPEHDVEYAMACMSDRRVRHLPVMDEGLLVGIISIGDVVRQRIDTLESESRTMRDYIQAREWRYHYGAAAADPDAASHL